jgi:hypothetical protein
VKRIGSPNTGKEDKFRHEANSVIQFDAIMVNTSICQKLVWNSHARLQLVQSPEAALQRYNWLRTYSSKMPYSEVVKEFYL